MKDKYMNHKEKKRIARRMMTNDEIKAKVPPFQSEAWEARKESKIKNVARNEAAAKKRKQYPKVYINA